jgi:outer membrane biosynthesis protein TonB
MSRWQIWLAGGLAVVLLSSVSAAAAGIPSSITSLQALVTLGQTDEPADDPNQPPPDDPNQPPPDDPNQPPPDDPNQPPPDDPNQPPPGDPNQPPPPGDPNQPPPPDGGGNTVNIDVTLPENCGTGVPMMMPLMLTAWFIKRR